ncbi:helix-turn-helix domain containing protein [Bacillus sp. OTU530]|uniref:helix-turn-helix domain containing protein n=1 Tax=Bacillus sp. OTU530 TaxID=3043862 RepID=UPI00313ADBE8
MYKSRVAVERRATYIALEDLNFLWDEDDVLKFREMWEEGLSLPAIAKQLKRKQNEVVVLVLDQAEEGKIKPRRGGLWGWVMM